MEDPTYLRNPNYSEQQAQQNPHYQRTPYVLAVKQLENGMYGIGKVREKRGKKVVAWEWVRNSETGKPLAFSNTYRAIMEKNKLEYGTVQQWRERWRVE